MTAATPGWTRRSLPCPLARDRMDDVAQWLRPAPLDAPRIAGIDPRLDRTRATGLSALHMALDSRMRLSGASVDRIQARAQNRLIVAVPAAAQRAAGATGATGAYRTATAAQRLRAAPHRDRERARQRDLSEDAWLCCRS